MTLPDAPVIHPDLGLAETLPAVEYHHPGCFARQRERVLARGWHLVADTTELSTPGWARPFTLLPGCLDEALVLTRDAEGVLHGCSNVCTHRGATIVDSPGPARSLRCPYHGRRFDLRGRLVNAPGFDTARNFPSPADDLPSVSTGTFARWVFASLAPTVAFDTLIAGIPERVRWVPFDRFTLDPASRREYLVDAHWALYTDNYLEGFHIPYVHPGLSSQVSLPGYATECFPHGTLQTVIAPEGAPYLQAPVSHPDHARRLAAYYLWMYPTTMVNVYPWGVSLNTVEPLGPTRTRVRFVSYVGDAALRDLGAGACLDTVECEDEHIVARVQQGVRSRLYRRGRYAPLHEAGVHHFHRLLAADLADDASR